MIALRIEPHRQFPGRLSVCSFSPSHSAKVVPWGLAAEALLKAQPQVASRELADLVSTKQFRSAQFVRFFFSFLHFHHEKLQTVSSRSTPSVLVILLELKTGQTTDCSFHASSLFFQQSLIFLPAAFLQTKHVSLLYWSTQWEEEDETQNKTCTVSVKQACQLLTLAWSDIFFGRPTTTIQIHSRSIGQSNCASGEVYLLSRSLIPVKTALILTTDMRTYTCSL